VRNNGDNNEKYVWLDEIGNHPDQQADRLDEIGNHPDRQAERFIARLWMAKVRK